MVPFYSPPDHLEAASAFHNCSIYTPCVSKVNRAINAHAIANSPRLYGELSNWGKPSELVKLDMSTVGRI
jgi:hypothetical protein